MSHQAEKDFFSVASIWLKCVLCLSLCRTVPIALCSPACSMAAPRASSASRNKMAPQEEVAPQQIPQEEAVPFLVPLEPPEAEESASEAPLYDPAQRTRDTLEFLASPEHDTQEELDAAIAAYRQSKTLLCVAPRSPP